MDSWCIQCIQHQAMSKLGMFGWKTDWREIARASSVRVYTASNKVFQERQGSKHGKFRWCGFKQKHTQKKHMLDQGVFFRIKEISRVHHSPGPCDSSIYRDWSQIDGPAEAFCPVNFPLSVVQFNPQNSPKKQDCQFEASSK